MMLRTGDFFKYTFSVSSFKAIFHGSLRNPKDPGQAVLRKEQKRHVKR